MKVLLTILLAPLIFTVSVFSRNIDWRNAKNGLPIYANGYCDQPYVVVLENGKWLCVFTTGEGLEGSGGQHIVSCVSNDQGKSWSIPVRIAQPGDESASWAMPYLTKYGRVYVFYSYNGEKIHELNGEKNIREDMLGWYCYRYSDDEGKTWSERHRLDVRKTTVDMNNDWKGKVQIMWGIGKPADVGNGMMFAFTKIGKFLLENSEGWFFRCDNINTEKNPAKLHWIMLPDSEDGMLNRSLGPVNEEQNIVQMNNGNIYCMYRTISGHPAESYSFDKGKTWTLPQIPTYENGIELKNPRACPRIWKCKNGKYLFWYHNHGGWDFTSRNPAWISGGIEKDGKIIWGQPEILFYEEDTLKRMSYPDLIEQDGKYWITETNKQNARCHLIPGDFLNKIWGQSERKTITTENLIAEWDEKALTQLDVLTIPEYNNISYNQGFTIDLEIELSNLAPGQLIFSSKSSSGKTIRLQTSDYGSIEIIMNNGHQISKWNSDPGLIKAFKEHKVAVTVDNGPQIIQFIVNGVVCNGRDYRQYGWTRFKFTMEDFDFSISEIGELSTGQLRPKGRLTNLRIYSRPLMNTEIIGNHNTHGQF